MPERDPRRPVGGGWLPLTLILLAASMAFSLYMYRRANAAVGEARRHRETAERHRAQALRERDTAEASTEEAHRTRREAERERRGAEEQRVLAEESRRRAEAERDRARDARKAEADSRDFADSAERRMGSLEDLLEGFLADPDPMGYGGQARVRDLLEQLGSRVEDSKLDRVTEARLRMALARGLTEIGSASAALPHAREGVSIFLNQRGKEHADSLRARRELAHILLSSGANEEARTTLDEVLQTSTESLGLDHPETLAAMSALADLSRTLGQWEEAETQLAATLEAQRRVLGEGHPDTLRTLHDLGVLLVDLGRHDDAEKKLGASLEVRRRNLGEKHPDTASTMEALAGIWFHRGETARAAEQMGEVLDIRRTALGEAHTLTLSTMSGLGQMKLHLAQLREAEDLSRMSHEGTVRIAGSTSDAANATRVNLAVVVLERGRWAEAISGLRVAYEHLREREGEEDPTALDVAWTLGIALQRSGDHQGAEEVLGPCLEMCSISLGATAPLTLEVARARALTAVALGRPKQAESLARRALDGHVRISGKESMATRVSMGAVARILAHRGEHEESLALARETLILDARLLAADDWRLANQRTLLAECFTKAGKYDEAEAALVPALEALHASHGDEHWRTRRAIERLAELYEAWGRPDRAAEYRGRLPAKPEPEDGEEF